MAYTDRTMGNILRLKSSSFRLHLKRFFFVVFIIRAVKHCMRLLRDVVFIIRVVKHCIRLLRDAVDAASLKVFKIRLIGSLKNLIH